MTHFDVVVVGAGVAGSAAAVTLASRCKVLLLEQFAFGHNRGSSHDGSRIFRHAYDDARYVRLAAAADAGWQALERDADERLLYRSGGLDIGPANLPLLGDIERSLATVGRPFERLTAAEVAARFPAFRLADSDVALFSPDAGVLPANRCLSTMQRLAHERGATLQGSEIVQAITPTRDGVDVVTNHRCYVAEHLILTAGPWLSEGPLRLQLPLHVEQQQVVYLEVERAPVFARGTFPVFINYQSWVYGFPLFERPDAIKVSDHSGAPTVRLSERSQGLDAERAASTAAKARHFLPAVSATVVDSDRCLYSKTPDEHFLMDLHPDYPQIVVGGGFSGHGFKFGPILSEILADLALEGRSSHDLSLFSATRFQRATGGSSSHPL